MKAGTLRHRVTVQTRTDAVDPIGQPVTTWDTVGSVWADVRYQTGLGAIKAGADVSVSKVSIRVRQAAYAPGQRIVYGNEVFSVKAVLPDGTGSHVDLLCEAINADS